MRSGKSAGSNLCSVHDFVKYVRLYNTLKIFHIFKKVQKMYRHVPTVDGRNEHFWHVTARFSRSTRKHCVRAEREEEAPERQEAGRKRAGRRKKGTGDGHPSEGAGRRRRRRERRRKRGAAGRPRGRRRRKMRGVRGGEEDGRGDRASAGGERTEEADGVRSCRRASARKRISPLRPAGTWSGTVFCRSSCGRCGQGRRARPFRLRRPHGG